MGLQDIFQRYTGAKHFEDFEKSTSIRSKTNQERMYIDRFLEFCS